MFLYIENYTQVLLKLTISFWELGPWLLIPTLHKFLNFEIVEGLRRRDGLNDCQPRLDPQVANPEILRHEHDGPAQGSRVSPRHISDARRGEVPPDGHGSLQFHSVSHQQGPTSLTNIRNIIIFELIFQFTGILRSFERISNHIS